MGVSEYLPVVAAGCCAAAVAYVALSQAYEAGGDAADAGKPSTSGTGVSKQAKQPSGTAVNGRAATDVQHAPEASPSGSGGSITANTSTSSSGDRSICNHCKKAPEKQEHLLRCSRCHHAWYCSKVGVKCAFKQPFLSPSRARKHGRDEARHLLLLA